MENRKEKETRQFIKRKKNNNERKRREQKWSSFYKLHKFYNY
jgi:hypothetical protein